MITLSCLINLRIQIVCQIYSKIFKIQSHNNYLIYAKFEIYFKLIITFCVIILVFNLLLLTVTILKTFVFMNSFVLSHSLTLVISSFTNCYRSLISLISLMSLILSFFIAGFSSLTISCFSKNDTRTICLFGETFLISCILTIESVDNV